MRTTRRRGLYVRPPRAQKSYRLRTTTSLLLYRERGGLDLCVLVFKFQSKTSARRDRLGRSNSRGFEQTCFCLRCEFSSLVRMEQGYRVYTRDVSISHSRSQKCYHWIQSLPQQSSGRHEETIRTNRASTSQGSHVELLINICNEFLFITILFFYFTTIVVFILGSLYFPAKSLPGTIYQNTRIGKGARKKCFLHFLKNM